jgi:hypothetical protein
MTPVVRQKGSIPIAAWVVAAILAGVSLLGVMFVLSRHGGGGFFPAFLLFLIGPAILSGYALLVGYVYADAKRRNMRYVMWTWLAILVPNGIGIILYFLLRDPWPVYCSRCGAPAQAGFAFCSQCGAGMAPACPNCHKICQTGWTHCPYCGGTLS